MITATKYKDISVAHRIVDHHGKCKFIHGHNYRIHFTCTKPQLDEIGMILDFEEIQKKLCDWVEENWDHQFLIWEKDPLIKLLSPILKNLASCPELEQIIEGSFMIVPFNTTAENMAHYLLEKTGFFVFQGSNVQLVSVIVEETRKCSVEAKL